jgi:hypothetical protein
MLALGARGAGAGLDEDDYNSNITTPTHLTITNQTQNAVSHLLFLTHTTDY